MNTTEKNPVVRLLPGTRKKLDRIAESRRWKINVTIDALADWFLEQDSISEPDPVSPRRRRGETVPA
jgi:hypothetical protein